MLDDQVLKPMPVKKVEEAPIDITESNLIEQFTVTNTNAPESMARFMEKIREDVQSSKKVRVSTKKPKNISFQNRPLNITKPNEMEEIVMKMMDDLKEKEKSKPLTLPSLNQQTPPLTVIKSHSMPVPKEQMAEIITKIKEDMEYEKESDWVEIRERKPLMTIFLNIAMKTIRESLKHFIPH